VRLQFLGATGTVTGSKYLLEQGGCKTLIDCGLFQGLKELRLRNWAPLPVAPNAIDAVVLTHAHIDHSGYVPLLVKNGFKGRIYCSEATFDLCSILLPDSGYLHEADADRANRYAYSKHKPALPLYTEQDGRDCLDRLTVVDFDVPHDLPGGLTFTLQRSGHILGSAFVMISGSSETGGAKSIVFSGDLGRPDDPVMKPPEAIRSGDYLVIESTYGDRLHEQEDPFERLGGIIRNTAARGGTVVIPAFAVGRTQSILYYLHELKKARAIPDVPVFLDSPMAINVTELMQRHRADHRLAKKLCADVCHVAAYSRTVEDSKSLDQANGLPAVIISASGMATGGRVLHHLKRFIGDSKNAIVFTGYQAAGTRGARLVHGDSEIKIHGKMWPVRARVEVLHNLSAHADYAEILDWLGNFDAPPEHTFITHGEPEAASSLARKIQDRLSWQVSVPEYRQVENL
jgi:metallo-beta-lactamase family protein